MEGLSSKNDTISVVVPLYNKEKTICRTLDDLFSQTCRNIEIVIVDDASRDYSLKVAEKKMKESQFPWQIISSPVNGGVSRARNKGIKSSGGDLVFFFDADDRIHETCLEKLHGEIFKSRSDMAFCGFSVNSEKAGSEKQYLPSFRRKGEKDLRKIFLKDFVRGKRWVNASNVMYKRELLEKHTIFFPEGCSFAEDREFILKALFHSKRVSFVEEVLCTYVQSEVQSTRLLSHDLSKYAHAAGIYRRLLLYFERAHAESFLLEGIREFELPNALVKMASSYASSGSRELFDKLISFDSFKRQIAPAWRAIHYKPEVAFKLFLLLYFPGLFFRKYEKKQV